jgi:aminoglycoside 2'-N-acetyltransferase I
MTDSTLVTFARTEDLDAATRVAIIQVCLAAHQEEDFQRLFDYVPAGGRHFLACRAGEVVSHALVTTRWLQPATLPILKTAYIDAVATLPIYQGQGYGSAVMRHLAQNIADYEIAGLETDRPSFYTRLGWEVWRGPLAGRSEQGLVPTPALNLDDALTIECQAGRIW